MGRHGDKDKPTDSGQGGDSDGQDSTKHGSEELPPQSDDEQGS